MPPLDFQPRSEYHHGTTITDPYAVLEAGTPEVAGWIAGQNAATEAWLSKHALPDSVERTIDAYFGAGELKCPFVHQDRIFQWKRVGDSNRKALFMRERNSDQERAVLDPNTYISGDAGATVSIPSDYVDVSKDGRFVAYQVSETGDEEYGRLEVKNIDTGDITDSIPGVRRSQVAWLPDNSGFYYTRIEDPTALNQAGANEEKAKRYVYFHTCGDTSYENDQLITKDKEWLGISVSEDGSNVFLFRTISSGNNDIFSAQTDTHPVTELTPLVVGQKTTFHPYIYGDYIYARTNTDAPMSKLLRIRRDSPDLTNLSTWEKVAGKDDRVLVSYDILKDTVIAHYSHKVSSQLELVDTKTGDTRSVELPTVGTVSDIHVDENGNRVYLRFESFGVPPTIFTLDTVSGQLTKQEQVEFQEDLPEIETRLVEYTSDDGTPISMFLVGPKGFEPNGDQKVLMTGYGGFEISDFSVPRFIGRSQFPTLLPWLTQGNIVAIPHIRGGGEYGKSWHEAGKKAGKLKTYQDFASAAKWLVQNNITTANKIAAWGRSNGGLLIAAMATMYPDQFGALISEVPLTDMINYIKLGGDSSWVHEFGDPENPDEFNILKRLSPYHNIQQGPVPPILILSSQDSNVNPAHALKFAARLQENNASSNPVLLDVDEGVGHGTDWPASKLAKKTKKAYTFIHGALAA